MARQLPLSRGQGPWHVRHDDQAATREALTVFVGTNHGGCPTTVEYGDGRKGSLDKTGKMVIVLGPEVQAAGGFDRGLARLTFEPSRPGGSCTFGYIDKSGRIVWPKPKPAADRP